MLVCKFCHRAMKKPTATGYCGKCSEERRRLARIHFYGCEHPRPVKMTRNDRYVRRDDSPCPVCGAVPPER